jgi:thioredoxin reductase
MYDAIIVGGGPAGLSAALILGRCRRRVVVCDSGRPRNAASRALHGFLTRDGVRPSELLRLGRAELRRYGVEFRPSLVTTAACQPDGTFTIRLRGGGTLRGRTLLLATGVTDRLPRIPGIEDFYGRSVFHCPYCDAWEVRDQPLAVYGRGKSGVGLAVSLKTWSRDVILFTNGNHLPPRHRDELQREGISFEQGFIRRLEGSKGVLRSIVLQDGRSIPRRAMFFSTGQYLHSDLPKRMGCKLNAKGTIVTNRLQGTATPGLYVAGDASKDVQLAIVAAAEGAKAGFAINKALQSEEQK